jgi:hypothetical protein
MMSRFLTRLRGRSPAPVAIVAAAARPFQAIAIYRGVKACAMAQRFSEHRFLARDAPSIPLAGCTMSASCECRYLKYKDRRSGERRLVDFAARFYSGKERRMRNGRRLGKR